MTLFPDEILDFEYDYASHNFNPGFIASNYNIKKNQIILNKDYILIKQRSRNAILAFSQNIPINFDRRTIIKSETKFGFCDIKVKEIYYNLFEIFSNPTKDIRRWSKFFERDDVILKASNDDDINFIFNSWKSHKLENSKLFTRTFNPEQYLRCFNLYKYGYNIEQFLIYIKNRPYGIINYCVNEKTKMSYELAFCSLFWDKELKLINDQNISIIVSSMKKLYDKGVITMNTGMGDESGLNFFKTRIPYRELILWRSKIIGKDNVINS